MPVSEIEPRKSRSDWAVSPAAIARFMLEVEMRQVDASARLSTSASVRSRASSCGTSGPGATTERSCCRYTRSTSAGRRVAMALPAASAPLAMSSVPGVLGA